MLQWVVGLMSERTATDSDVVEQPARSTVRGVHWTEESPTFGQQLADSGGFHLCEIGSSVD